ncbi:hypothetical protein [Streptomyces mayteni]
MNRVGYWCEVTVVMPARPPRVWALGCHLAGTPRLALRWLRGQAARLARALDPSPEPSGPFPAGVLHPVPPATPNPGRVFGDWLDDVQAQERQLEALKAGQLVVITAGSRDRVAGEAGEFELRYRLTARISKRLENPSFRRTSPARVQTL